MKTHYRKAYKSDHLGTADLEDYIEQGRVLNFVITHVNYQKGTSVAGRKGDFNIAYFKDKKVKPLVLNATNAAMIKKFCKSPFIEDWKNVAITLYIKEGIRNPGTGETGGAVRISPVQPQLKKPKLNRQHPKWDEVVGKFKKGQADISTIKKYFDLTRADEEFLINLKPEDNA